MLLLSMSSIVLAAAYSYGCYKKLHWVNPTLKWQKLSLILSKREGATLIPLDLLVLWIELYPGPLMNLMDASETNLVDHMIVGTCDTGGLCAIKHGDMTNNVKSMEHLLFFLKLDK